MGKAWSLPHWILSSILFSKYYCSHFADPDTKTQTHQMPHRTSKWQPELEYEASDSLPMFPVIHLICVNTPYVPFRISSNRIWMGKQFCSEDVSLPICQLKQFYFLYCFLFGEVSQLYTHYLYGGRKIVNCSMASLLIHGANFYPLPWKTVLISLQMCFNYFNELNLCFILRLRFDYPIISNDFVK